MPVTDKIPEEITAGRSIAPSGTAPSDTHAVADLSAGDGGTRALVRTGFWVTLAGVLALIATKTLFGGIGIDGPLTNAGWLAFMFALMGIPFGLLLLVLGSAKWLRNRRLRRQ